MNVKLTARNLQKSDIPVTVIQVFLEKNLLLTMLKCMQLGFLSRHVGSFIGFSRLKLFVKCCKILSSKVILKSLRNVIFS